MIQEGKLTLDTKLSEFFPEIQNSEDITIRHMLRHQSGIRDYTDDHTFWIAAGRPMKNTDLLSRIASYESLFKPGEREVYSNSNYTLLAMVAEKIDRRNFDRILNRRIIRPAGLRNTQISDRTNARRNEAVPHYHINVWTPNTQAIHSSATLGAGGIISNASDINKFLTKLFNDDLVSLESLGAMVESDNHFGSGLLLMPFYDKIALGHTGGIAGFQSIVAYFPIEKISVAYLSNAVLMPRNDIMVGVLSILFGRDYELPVFFEAVQLSKEILNNYIGLYDNEVLPIQLSVFIVNEQLWVQGTGQIAIPLAAINENTFIYEAENIKIEFVSDKDTLILWQAGYEFEFVRRRD